MGTPPQTRANSKNPFANLNGDDSSPTGGSGMRTPQLNSFFGGPGAQPQPQLQQQQRSFQNPSAGFNGSNGNNFNNQNNNNNNRGGYGGSSSTATRSSTVNGINDYSSSSESNNYNNNNNNGGGIVGFAKSMVQGMNDYNNNR
mmetsp:Transcript_101830/g.206935  ORF Transcript_101830/g.206935 Transcript_101830/m.206935 type:complete len:143 (-) Transcript_101830:1158-1586(-)